MNLYVATRPFRTLFVSKLAFRLFTPPSQTMHHMIQDILKNLEMLILKLYYFEKLFFFGFVDTH